MPVEYFQWNIFTGVMSGNFFSDMSSVDSCYWSMIYCKWYIFSVVLNIPNYLSSINFKKQTKPLQSRPIEEGEIRPINKEGPQQLNIPHGSNIMEDIYWFIDIVIIREIIEVIKVILARISINDNQNYIVVINKCSKH